MIYMEMLRTRVVLLLLLRNRITGMIVCDSVRAEFWFGMEFASEIVGLFGTILATIISIIMLGICLT